MAAIWRLSRASKSVFGAWKPFRPLTEFLHLQHIEGDGAVLTGHKKVLAYSSISAKEYEHNDSLDFIAKSMKTCLSHLGPWTIGDLSFGIKALLERHEDQADTIEGEPVKDRNQMEEWLQDIKVADAIYERSKERVVENCNLEADDIIEFHTNADRLRPAFCIAVRAQAKQVLLIVRGTRSPADAVTILTGSAADFMEGSTHAGMLHSAEWLLHHKTKTLVDLLERNPGFALHFIGHSLGAGAAALYALMLRHRQKAGEQILPRGVLPSCLAIATPACCTQQIAESCRDFVTTIVCQNDLVPRASLYAFERLRMEVKATHWQEELEQLIDEGMSEWSDKLNVDAVAEQFKRMADLLTKSYPGTAKIVATVGSAWERVASNTSKNYSDTMATLLGKTSLRIAKLPATGTSQKRKITYPGKSPSTKNAVKRQRPESDAGDDRDKEQDKEGLRWGMNALLGTSKRSKGSWLAQNVGRWWKSKNGPSLGASKTWDDSKAEQQFSWNVERIASSHSSKVPQSDQQPIPLASDGDADSELSQLLIDVEEAEERKENKLRPVSQMYAPGRLVFLHRLSGDGEDGRYRALEGHEGQSFGRIILTKSMITDHLGATYIAAMRSCIKEAK